MSSLPSPRTIRKRARSLGRGDRIFLTVIIGIPLAALLFFVWLPALASLALSFTTWDGIELADIQWIGLENYKEIFTNYPPFWPAVQHNVIWLLFTALLPTPFGIFLAYQLDRKIRFTKFYQTAIFLPMVLSLAVVGFIWEIIYNPDTGLLNGILNAAGDGNHIDWLGNPDLNLWAVLVASAWRHTGYIMILYLAGLKGFDPALKEAAALDGANGRQTFLRVVFPALKPVNIIILVVTVMESLRAFDIVYVLGGGVGSKPGMELLSLLITDNIIGESSHIGYGSALAVILLLVSLAAIGTFLVQTVRKEDQ
ncbi:MULTISPECIES: carbohydrate ABC transporter permease [unclassified Streptomyces]|uniref:carbohydrate ABC transporter permease n=1 Tax=unclassified Streptomyces TaxID=2593676 RepID=UPI002254B4E1|nr:MULTISPECIES: sugar ABC transporter permease [unclassified Streptomyces]WTB43672.1 sugar ABC transporter permease [Streptomyces sp. NBC_00827]WUC08596.1 sugar ABC transporter permease [Streptomyces sp. NBC_00564]WUC54986.1 sugar ABC transporter permease [Streptomyces sp. NBC_00554]MCX4977349.1 sugar ABC transporter permease [Streptomyces sp. NBC_00620]WRZ25098.1 sugar ABC transporter permease [Streptomyces sp. NBC_00243]